MWNSAVECHPQRIVLRYLQGNHAEMLEQDTRKATNVHLPVPFLQQLLGELTAKLCAAVPRVSAYVDISTLILLPIY